jgi:nucleotide-binding universal stress UspA family protein
MKILLAVDGSPFTKHMLAYLAAHDELLGADREYTVIHAVPPLPTHVTGYIDKPLVEDFYRDEARKVLDPVVAFAAQQGWKLNMLQPVGRAADVIAETADAGKYDLVVMGSHGHTPVGSIVLGSVAQRVLAQCKAPVLIVR